MHKHLLDPELSLKGDGFSNPQGVSQMLVYQKTMFDRYYCIELFCHLKLWKKASKSSFLYYYNGAQSMKDSYVLKKPVP